jgi:hypothetical protein
MMADVFIRQGRILGAMLHRPQGLLGPISLQGSLRDVCGHLAGKYENALQAASSGGHIMEISSKHVSRFYSRLRHGTWGLYPQIL